MASSFNNNSFICVIILLITSFGHVHGCYESIISFGDSLADTGNLIRLSKSNKIVASSVLPYGETFFHHPTGRFSDGRLVIDFIAEGMGFPLVPPYVGVMKNMSRSKNSLRGVNFAVAGATAVDISYLEKRGIKNPATNVSLGTQLEWFKQMLPILCDSPTSCKEFLENSLFLMGEIGGNDYNHPFSQGKSGEDVQSFVPAVISAIGLAINELIELGAQTLIVPGNLPIGCSASYLTIFKNSNKEDYDDSTGCINWLNDFAEYHNQLLQQEIHKLREIHPHANIIYADYYNAAMQIYKSPKKFGFTSTIVACCGGGGPYNYDSKRPCGSPSSNYCDTPSSYVSWDGVHLTEAAYKLIAKGLLQGPYTIPQMNNGLCNKGISDQ
ncbi:GDSL esterase/lipase At1g28590-like [Solanum stenotomum]|uniref:GDSL esterase/lipase At1g28590-like n=1 Tax=Solanum stenotomum TaxID=172797 RepID=UPI0020D1B4D1|nr:GDSL esterase/lipase At1g28590-like [Solanum stenotomum]